MAGRLADKVALVSGGARGIGEAIVRRFVEEGARVAVADVDASPAQELVDELGGQTSFEHLDVTDAHAWEAVVGTVVARWGTLDVLVNNAGVGAMGLVDELPVAEHRRVMDVNVDGVLFGIRAAAAPMRAQRSGSIINISSIDGLVGVLALSSYAASKFAVTGLTRTSAIDLGPAGVRVNSIHPGVIDTPMLTPDVRPRLERLVAMQPIARMGRPEEIASLALFLASDEAGFITGSQVVIDGGHLAGPWRPPVGE